jgi:hypothetical protein
MRNLDEFGYRSFDSYRGRESSRGVHYSDHDYGAFGHHNRQRPGQRDEYRNEVNRYSNSADDRAYGPNPYHQGIRERSPQQSNWRESGNNFYRDDRTEYASGQNTRGNDSHNQYNDWNRQRQSSDQDWGHRNNNRGHAGNAHRGSNAAHEYAQRELWERQHRTGQHEPGHRLDFAAQANEYSRNHGWDDAHPKDWNTSPNRSYYDEF